MPMGRIVNANGRILNANGENSKCQWVGGEDFKC